MIEDRSVYGLIGYPISHSLSPVMHNTAFKELGVDAVYKLFPLEEDGLDDFFNDLRDEKSSIFGLNVTVPYKEKVLKYIDNISPFAQKVGAINTIVLSRNRKLLGYNTDGPGFLTHLTEIGFEAGGKQIVILGAGGAARAILSVLCLIEQKPQSIRIFDIDKDKAGQLLNDFRHRFDISCVENVKSIDDLSIERADLLINTTPVGMKKNDPPLLEDDLLHPGLLVYDVIYNPKETLLLRMAKAKGAKISNGLGMLFYQGVLALQHWAETQIDDDIKKKMRKKLEERLEGA